MDLLKKLFICFGLACSAFSGGSQAAAYPHLKELKDLNIDVAGLLSGIKSERAQEDMVRMVYEFFGRDTNEKAQREIVRILKTIPAGNRRYFTQVAVGLDLFSNVHNKKGIDHAALSKFKVDLLKRLKAIPEEEFAERVARAIYFVADPETKYPNARSYYKHMFELLQIPMDKEFPKKVLVL